MRFGTCFAIIAMTMCAGGCGARLQSPQGGSPEESKAVTATKADDVEAILRREKWQSRSGLSSGVAWQFVDGGKVLIHDGGNVDESYRWEIVSRNESARKITIKFWKPGDTEHRQWTFTFGPEGQPAQKENFVYRGAAIVDSDETLLYPMN